MSLKLIKFPDLSICKADAVRRGIVNHEAQPNKFGVKMPIEELIKAGVTRKENKNHQRFLPLVPGPPHFSDNVFNK